eukprot:gene25889-34855_t
MQGPPGLRAAHLFAPGAPVRPGTRIRIMDQWQCNMRVNGGMLEEALWGGNDTATFEVTPAGAAVAVQYDLWPKNWIANVGDTTAYVRLLPPTSRSPPPKWYLEIPPNHKAVLLVACEDNQRPLSAARELPKGHTWRSIAYNTQNPAELLEWCLCVEFATRHITAADPVVACEAALRRAAHASLGKVRKCHAQHTSSSALGAESYMGNRIAEWIAARVEGHGVDHLEVDRNLLLTPTNNAADDARRAFEVYRTLRSKARQDLGEARRSKAAKRKQEEAECIATDRGTTQRLLGKPGPAVIAIVENADGTAATGSALPQAVWEQSRGMRSDYHLRRETHRFIRDYPAERRGPPLTPERASSLLWGLNSSAPGVDQISARMLRHVEAWVPEAWLMWIQKQNMWREDLAAGKYDELLLWILEMRLGKGKKQLLVEACRPVGMEPIRIRLEQLECARHFRSGIAEGDIVLPPTQCAYQPGVSAGTAHRINTNCDLDARHRYASIAKYSEDKADAFGRIRHKQIAEDLLKRGMPGDVVLRLVIFWAFAQIFVITAAGLTAAYSQDHAAIQGDMVAQLVFLLYVVPAYEAVAREGVGYRFHLTGYPTLHIPMISYSDDNLVVTHLAQHLARCVRAAGAALLSRLLHNNPLKGAAIAVIWRVDRGELRPRSHRFELVDQGVLVPIFTLRSHIPYLGFELCIFAGHAWTVKRIRGAIQRVWYGAIRGHLRAVTARLVHQQVCLGTVNHLAQVNPPPRPRLAECDAQVGGAYRRKATNGGRIAAISSCVVAHHIASLIKDLNSRLFPARATTREMLIHAYANPLETDTEYAYALRNINRLHLTLIAAAPLPGKEDDPQLQRLEQLGLPRAPAYHPPRAAAVPRKVHVDESQGLGTGAVTVVSAAPTGQHYDKFTIIAPSHITARDFAAVRPPQIECSVDNTRALNITEGHWVDRWPQHLVPYAEELWRESRHGRLRVCMAAPNAFGIQLADGECRAERKRACVDRRSVLSHPRGHVHFWLADASTHVVYADPREEVLRRQAAAPEPYLWAHVDDPLTRRGRVGRNLSLFADGCLCGMQLGALSPRGTALRGAVGPCPRCGQKMVSTHHPYTECQATVQMRYHMMNDFAKNVTRLSGADADAFWCQAREVSTAVGIPGAVGPQRPAHAIRWKGHTIQLLTPAQWAAYPADSKVPMLSKQERRTPSIARARARGRAAISRAALRDVRQRRCETPPPQQRAATTRAAAARRHRGRAGDTTRPVEGTSGAGDTAPAAKRSQHRKRMMHASTRAEAVARAGRAARRRRRRRVGRQDAPTGTGVLAAPPAKGTQRTLTDRRGPPPDVDVQQPLRHPSFCPVAQRWMHVDPEDITQIIRARWCCESILPLRDRARAAAARKYPSVSSNELHAEDQRLAEEICANIRNVEHRDWIRSQPWHVVLGVFAEECLPDRPRPQGVARSDHDVVDSVDDAALRTLALRSGRGYFLERDRVVEKNETDNTRGYTWPPLLPPALAHAGGHGCPTPGELLRHLEIVQPQRVPCPPRRRFRTEAELEEAMLLPDDVLRDAPLHERPWDRGEEFDEEPDVGPGPDWAHIDMAAESDDPYCLRDPSRGAGAAAEAAEPRGLARPFLPLQPGDEREEADLVRATHHSNADVAYAPLAAAAAAPPPPPAAPPAPAAAAAGGAAATRPEPRRAPFVFAGVPRHALMR